MVSLEYQKAKKKNRHTHIIRFLTIELYKSLDFLGISFTKKKEKENTTLSISSSGSLSI